MPLRPEPVDDAVERTPRVEVGEQREVEAVVDLGVGQRVGVGAEHGTQLVAAALGGDLAGGAPLRHGEHRRLVEVAVVHRVEHLLLGRLPT